MLPPNHPPTLGSSVYEWMRGAVNECLSEITVFEKSGGSHQCPNRHGRLSRVIIPRISGHPNWRAKRNSIADLRRQRGMLPGGNGGHRHG